MVSSKNKIDLARKTIRLANSRVVLPKYHRLKQSLRDKIAQMHEDDAVPSEAELCRAHKVSRTTVRKALNDLAQEGLVYTSQGKGTFVASRKMPTGWVQRTGGMYSDMTDRGHTVRVVVLEQGLTPSDERVAKELQIAPGATVVRFVRLRFVDEKPFDTVTNYLPAERFPGLEKLDMARSLYAILRNQYGVKFDHGTRRIEAGMLPPREAKLLHAKSHTPMLVMYSTMFDDQGRAIEHGVVHQRSDTAQIVIDVIAQ